MKNLSSYLTSSDREQYETHVRRLNYDDRDFVFYKNMLEFLWQYVIGQKQIENPSLVFEIYTYWNMRMIDKVLYHDHDVPYANIRRCYQSILELIRHDPEAGIKQIDAIGLQSFSYDGKAPKIRMDERGRVFRPMSKLFVIYNFAKYFRKNHLDNELEQWQKKYNYAFTLFEDGEHDSHDRYLIEQMEILSDKIVYPIEEKVYKIPWGPKDFYLYYDENSYVSL